jgi:hypothetical protein
MLLAAVDRTFLGNPRARSLAAKADLLKEVKWYRAYVQTFTVLRGATTGMIKLLSAPIRSVSHEKA